MAGVRGLFLGIPPEPDLEGSVQRDPDPLEHIHVEASQAPFNPSDDLPIDAREVREVLLRPVPPESRRTNLAAQLHTLLARPSIGFDHQGRTSTAAHGHLEFGMLAE